MLARRVVSKPSPVSDSSSKAHSGRPHAVGILLAALLSAAFLAGFWRPLADGFDRIYPTRSDVARLADPGVQLDVSVHPEASDDDEIRSALGVLPGTYVRRARDAGGRFVIVQHQALSGIAVAGKQTELHEVVGLYVPSERVAYVAGNTDAVGETALHEFGHMLDHLLGEPSSKGFTPVYESARRDRKIAAKFRDSPSEFFAEFFAAYYFSDRSRAWLERRFPEAHAYFARLEREPAPPTAAATEAPR